MIEHIVPSIDFESSGPTYSVVRLCESLINLGHSVSLNVLGPNIGQATHQPFVRRFSYGYGPARLGQSSALKRSLHQRAATGEISLLHNHSLWMMPNVYPGLSAAKYRLPYVVSPRGTLSAWAMNSGSPVKRLFWPLVQRPSLKAVSCFHATARSEYADIRHMGFKQPVAIIPNGIDVHSPRKRECTDDLRTLLFLGRIHPVKGLDLLLSAWQAVQSRFPEWRLRIVGAGDAGFSGQMRRFAIDLGLERVEFSGPLYGRDKWAAYTDADLFVLPTYSENFGVAVAESLAAGTPAIVSQGAPWQGLRDKGAGWWIEIGLDPLVACLSLAMSQTRHTLSAMGLIGRDWMINDYCWQRVALQMAETYSWLQGQQARPSWVIID